MKKFNYEEMKGGWFIGDFEPAAFKTKTFEVAYVKHKKGDPWDKHFHKIATEITLVIRGKVKINDEIYSAGDIVVIEPNEIADPYFLEDVEFMIIKTPSDVNDKYTTKR
jgi:quercetin dioxygenase-like cupin family protein